jgi:hypothetical protein
MKKAIAILLAVCFVLSLTAAAASAGRYSNHHQAPTTSFEKFSVKQSNIQGNALIQGTSLGLISIPIGGENEVSKGVTLSNYNEQNVAIGGDVDHDY